MTRLDFDLPNPGRAPSSRDVKPGESSPLLPPASIGILGGGQLGRMSAMAARRLGYRVHTFDPSPDACAAPVADSHTAANYDDTAALLAFAAKCDVVTLEFENIPPAALEKILAAGIAVHPGPGVLGTAQNRRREKEFLGANGFPCAPFRVVESAEALKKAVAELGLPCVLKTADFGYDGKGQIKIRSAEDDLDAVWKTLGASAGVLEGWIHFAMEVSVIVARSTSGETAVFPVCENVHRNHILHLTLTPARISPEVEKRAREVALAVAEKTGVVGLLAVELFVMPDGAVLVNEMAPRPHNSGHHTLDACETSQFEQHIRAVCGLPLGGTAFLRPAAMVNLLGDVWPADGSKPDWTKVLREPAAKLHLYDKGRAAKGRKMGHFTVTADTAEKAVALAESLFDRL